MRLRGTTTAALAAALLFALALPAGAQAICAAPTEKPPPPVVVLDAVALSGLAGPSGSLVSPARMRVLRYVRGDGPRNLRIRTGTIGPQGLSVVSETPNFRAGDVVRLRLRRGDARRLRQGRVIASSVCKPMFGRPARRSLPVIPESETTLGEWRARVRAGRGGVRCLSLRGRSECAVVGRRGALVTVLARGDRTGVTAWGPRVERVEVTPPGGEPASAASGRRPPVFVLDDAVQAYDVRVEVFFEDGSSRVFQGDAARRAFHVDPTGERWTALSTRRGGRVCSSIEGTTLATACRSASVPGWFELDATDPARLVVHGIAGPDVEQLVVSTPSATVQAARAERGGAFLAVLAEPPDPERLTVTATYADGTVLATTGRRTGRF